MKNNSKMIKNINFNGKIIDINALNLKEKENLLKELEMQEKLYERQQNDIISGIVNRGRGFYEWK